ncbi:hypothetical protein [Azonexus sp. R2A61]|uniref:hypothetical protein n=1 Tax=Azonexus sp. R2A61 TaxID=2744443 RepID=UPI001F37C13F|nr:hypothetical protein [Azonexus sp. R2A61]
MDQNSIVMKAKLAVIESACGICTLPELELLKRLEELWLQGFSAGKEALEPILKDVSGELSKIALAHMTGDQERLKAVLDDFMQRHVKVVVATDKAKAH